MFSRGLSYLISTINAKRMPVPEGDWLVFRVYSNKNIKISTSSRSSILYTRPGAVYPAVELPSIVLLSTGLGTLMGCLGWKGRRTLVRS